LIETISELLRLQRQMQQEYGCEPTTEKLARRMDLPVGKVRKIMRFIADNRVSSPPNPREVKIIKMRFGRQDASKHAL
jgi:RNA polymerase primary sigma factor